MISTCHFLICFSYSFGSHFNKAFGRNNIILWESLWSKRLIHEDIRGNRGLLKVESNERSYTYNDKIPKNYYKSLNIK